MTHISDILADTGLLANQRTHVIGVSGFATSALMGARVSDETLLDAAEIALETDNWMPQQAVVVDPQTGVVDEVLLIDDWCPYVLSPQAKDLLEGQEETSP